MTVRELRSILFELRDQDEEIQLVSEHDMRLFEVARIIGTKDGGTGFSVQTAIVIRKAE